MYDQYDGIGNSASNDEYTRTQSGIDVKDLDGNVQESNNDMNTLCEYTHTQSGVDIKDLPDSNGGSPQKSKNALWAIIIASCAIVITLIVISIFVFASDSDEDDIKKAKDEFLPPAQVVEIDYLSKDPSNDQITFEYDEYKRIIKCRYAIKNFEYEQQNNYDDNSQQIQIDVLYKDKVIVEQTFDYADVLVGEKVTTVEDYFISSPDYREVSSTGAEKPAKPQTETHNDNWKQLYKDRINTYMNGEARSEDVQFSLILIDDNDVPELLISYPSHMSSSLLCWVYDDNLYEDHSVYTISQGVTYIEKSGRFREHSIFQGAGGDKVCEIDCDQIVVLGSGEVDEAVNYTYEWEGESLSKEEYNNKLNVIFDTSVAKDSVEVIYTYDEILDVIDDYGNEIAQDVDTSYTTSLSDVLEDGYWVDYSPQAPMFSAYSFENDKVTKIEYSFQNGKVEYFSSSSGGYTISGNSVTCIFDDYTQSFDYLYEYDEMQYTITDDPYYEGTLRVFHYDTIPEYSVAEADSKNRVV